MPRYRRTMFGVGDVVRRLRIKRRWTIDELAQRAGVNKMTVSAIERGHNYTRTRLDAVARALDLSNGSALEATLQEWAAKLAAPVKLTDAAREWLELYDVLSLDAEAYRDFRQILMRHVRLIQDRRGVTRRGSPTPASTAPPTVPPQETGHKTPKRRRR